MSLLFQVVRSSYCRSTHHKLALDALPLMRGPRSVRWQSVFLRHHVDYLEGSKDPDKVFRDFENHVLHVKDDYWGGACERARYWYDATVRALRSRNWEVAAYNAGVMSHYLTDPMMPLHTAQSEAEGNVHRAMEWSVCKAYEPIWKLALEETGLPVVEPGTNDTWLEELVTAGAEIANGYYDELIERYDFAAGKRNPPKGLDLASRRMIGQMFGFAIVTLARVLERACAEAREETEPPLALPSLDWFFATLEVPIQWVTRRVENGREAELIRAQYREFRKTGRVRKHLSEDVRVIQELYGAPSVPADSGSTPSPSSPSSSPSPKPEGPPRTRQATPSSAGTTAGGPPANHRVAQPASPATAPSSRSAFLSEGDPVERAPSIGPKTAARLEQAEIFTVADLVNADPETVASLVDASYVNADAVRDWQDQTRLVLTVPRLRGHDAQILVGSGFRSAEEVARSQPEELLSELAPFLDSETGSWLLRDEQRPDLREVTRWIGSAAEVVTGESAAMGLPS